MNEEEIEEDFSDLCRPETQARLHDLIQWYSKPEHYSEDALTLFRGMMRKAERSCGFIVRSMFEYSQNPTLKPQEKRRTMIGYSQYEINENGTLNIIPEPQPEKSKVPDPEPECLIVLRQNEQKKGERACRNAL